jgi:deoxyribose-phosphate aldolase
MLSKQQFNKAIDHTLLKATATRDDILRFCDEAASHHFAAVVLFPYWVPTAVKRMHGTDIKICTVISFPHGAGTRAAKVYEARNAISIGAEEIDMVINIGALKSGDYEYVEQEVNDIVTAAKLTGSTLVKLIIEAPVLTQEEKIKACHIAVNAGVDFVKTSTGTQQNGSAEEDVKLIRQVVGPNVGIKAAGGIRTVEQAMNLLDAGANRLGTSAGVALAEGYDPEDYYKGMK